MGWAVMQQPNGLYAVYNTVSGYMEVVNCTEDEIKQLFIEDSARSAVAAFNEHMERLRFHPKKTSSYADKHWEYCLETIEEVHGKEWREKLERNDREGRKDAETTE